MPAIANPEKGGLSVAVISFVPDWGHTQPLLRLAGALADGGFAVHCYIPSESAPMMKRFAFETTYLDPMNLDLSKVMLQKSLTRGIFFNRYSGYVYRNTYYFGEVFQKVGQSAQRLKERLLAQKPDVVLAEDYVFADFYARIGEELGVPVVLNGLDGGLAGKQRPFVQAFGFVAGVPPAAERAVEIAGAVHAKLYTNYFRLTRLRTAMTSRAASRQGTAAFRRAFPKTPARGRIAGRIYIGSACVEKARLKGKLNTNTSADEHVFPPIHFRSWNTIPEDLKAWLDVPSDLPVVYVSFGSIVEISRQFAIAVHEGLKRVKARILWSLPTHQRALLDSLVPAENIRLEIFVPQPEVLMHPAVGCFLTQGGPWSMQEAWFGGVPVLCTPFFADQPYNALIVELLGIGRRLWRNQVTAESIATNVSEILANPQYRDRAREISQDLRDHNGADGVVTFMEGVARRKAEAAGSVVS